MNPDQTSPLFILLPLSAFLLLFFAALFFLLRRMQKRQAAAILKRFEGQTLHIVSSKANFFGLSSRGMRQLRGNGVLALSENVLFFQLWLSRNYIEIPLKNITGIETPRVFQRRSILRRLLRVNFTSDRGRPDAAAWYVNNLPEWKEALERLKTLRSDI